MVNSEGEACPHPWPVWFPERSAKAPATPAVRGANVGFQPAYPTAERCFILIWAGYWAGESWQIPACFAGETADRASYP